MDQIDSAILTEIGERLPERAWRAVEWNESHVVSEATVNVGDKQITIRRRQLIGDEELQKINKHLYDTSSKFSDREIGAIGTPVANIPLSLVFSPKTRIAEKMREGDREHLRWFLNREENLPFRTQKGRL